MAESAPAAALQLLQEFQQVQARRAELYTQLSTGFRQFLEHGQEGVLVRLMQGITPGFNEVSKQVIASESCLRSSAVDRSDLASLLRQVQELERNKLKLTLSWQALRAAHASGRFSWQSRADRPRISGAHSQQHQQRQQQQEQQQQELQCMLERMQLQRAGRQAAEPGSRLASSVVNGDDVAAGSTDQHLHGPQQVEGFMSVKPGFYEQQLQRAAAAAAAADASAAAERGNSSSNQQQQQQHCAHSSCMGHDHGLPDPLEVNSLEPTEAEYSEAVRESLQEIDKCVQGINEVLEEVREAVLELQHEAA